MYFICSLILILLLCLIAGFLHFKKSFCGIDYLLGVIIFILIAGVIAQLVKDFQNPHEYDWKVECIKSGKKIIIKEFDSSKLSQPFYKELCE